MKTVLLSFADDITRDKFFQSLKEIADKLVTDHTEENRSAPTGELILAALSTVKLDPPIKADHERVVSIFVSGQKMAEGTLASMQKRFQQETGSHSGSVELRELRNGEWIVISSRRHQKPQLR